MKIIFSIIAHGYRVATRIRNYCYDKHIFPVKKSNLPVISIGNLSVGGTGKTPLCMWLVEELKKRDFKPVVLTRGYGGSEVGPVLVTKFSATNEVGDEPVLIATRTECAVVVSRNRFVGAQFIEQRNLGNIIILDDGFQHRALHRDVDVICVDASSDESANEFVTADLLPLGRFREDKAAALKRAHFIVINSRQSELLLTAVEKIRASLPAHCPAFETRLVVDGFFDGMGAKGSLEKGTEISAFCGLANPDGFFNTIENLGLKLRNHYALQDHQSISEADLLDILKEKLPVVCSEKDQVKLGEAYRKILALRVSLKINVGEKLIVGILSRCQPTSKSSKPTSFKAR